jgi:hypothetical protein
MLALILPAWGIAFPGIIVGFWFGQVGMHGAHAFEGLERAIGGEKRVATNQLA